MISEIHAHEDPILTREEAIEILNTPDDQLDTLIERAGILRKKYKGNRVSIHILTNVRSGNCTQTGVKSIGIDISPYSFLKVSLSIQSSAPAICFFRLSIFN